MANVQLWGWNGDSEYLIREWDKSLSNYTVADDKTLKVKSGGTISTTTVGNSGMVCVYGGTANTTTVKNMGTLWAETGTVRNITIESGGDLMIGINNKTAVLTGKVTISSGASVMLYRTAILDFDISAQKPGTTPLVTNMNMINGYASANYCITVSASQASGKYTLASNVPGGVVALVFAIYNSGGAFVSGISVGETVARGKKSYSLAVDSGKLTFTVGTSSKSGDLNGDGRADVIMSITKSGHAAYGATGAWLIQSSQTAKWGDLSKRNSGWTIFGTGTTGAGKKTEDVYLKSSGNVVGAWTMNDSGKVSGWKTVASFDGNTNVLNLGDFNGDGQTDLLLRNKNGAVGCYLTSGSKTGWNYFQSLGSEWKIAGVGDLNGDGIDDVVLKHDAGFAGSWLTQSDCTMKWANLDTLQSGYSIVGCGDFNGDGTADVLLKKGNYYGAWLVKNGSVNSWMGLGSFAGTVEEIADFDADGRDDLRLRTTAGDIGVELVKGADSLQWKYYGSVGSEWSTSLACL